MTGALMVSPSMKAMTTRATEKVEISESRSNQQPRPSLIGAGPMQRCHRAASIRSQQQFPKSEGLKPKCLLFEPSQHNLRQRDELLPCVGVLGNVDVEHSFAFAHHDAGGLVCGYRNLGIVSTGDLGEFILAPYLTQHCLLRRNHFCRIGSGLSGKVEFHRPGLAFVNAVRAGCAVEVGLTEAGHGDAYLDEVGWGERRTQRFA